MRIKNLQLIDYRRFAGKTEIDFDDTKNVTVLLGNNGAGKSSILDAIARMIGTYSRRFPQVSTGYSDFTDSDVHIIDSTRRADHMTISTNLIIDGLDVFVSRSRKGDGLKTPVPVLKGINERAEYAFDRIKSEDKSFMLPVLAYYGTGRGNITFSRRRRDFRKVFKRWDCYTKALNPAVDFKSCFEHFDFWEDEERRAWKQLGTQYTSPALNTIREAFSKCIKGFSNPRTELRPLRFVMDELDAHGRKREIRIEQMSDGFKIMIAMINDIASRMVDANPDSDNPLDAPGIVLIDEIDLHLHPEWQRTVLSELTSCFKNVQFIVTTHSPIIITGASEFAQIISIGDNGEIHYENSDIVNYSVNQTLRSSLFEGQPIYSPKWDEDIKRRDEILQKPTLTEQDNNTLKDLDDRLSTLSLSETSGVIISQKMIHDLYRQISKDNESAGEIK